MRKRGELIFVALLILLLKPFSFSYGEDKNYQVVYFELFGNAIVYSLNYERTIYRDFSGRVGIAYIAATTGENRINFLISPLMVNYLLGSSKHKLELGLGPVMFIGLARIRDYDRKLNFKFLFVDIETEPNKPVIGSDISIAVTGTIGYRYQPGKQGLIFRIAFTPLIQKKFGSWFGISLGYRF